MRAPPASSSCATGADPSFGESGGKEGKRGRQRRRRLRFRRRHGAEGVIELKPLYSACRQRVVDLNVRETAGDQSADGNRAPEQAPREEQVLPIGKSCERFLVGLDPVNEDPQDGRVEAVDGRVAANRKTELAVGPIVEFEIDRRGVGD